MFLFWESQCGGDLGQLGIFHCDQLNLMLLDRIERYEPDEDDRKELFEAEQEQNFQETDSMHTRAVL